MCIEYSGEAVKVEEHFLNAEARLDGHSFHMCTEKFEFSGYSQQEIWDLINRGYEIYLNK